MEGRYGRLDGFYERGNKLREMEREQRWRKVRIGEKVSNDRVGEIIKGN